MTLAASRSSFGRANGVSRGGSLGPSIFSQSPTAKASTSLFVPRLPGPAWVPGVVWPALTPFQQRGRAGNDASLLNAKTSPHRGVNVDGWRRVLHAAIQRRCRHTRKTPMLVASSQPLPPPARMRGDTHGRRATGGGRWMASPPRGRHWLAAFENRGLGLRGRCRGVDDGKSRDETRSLGRPDLAAISVDVEHRRDAVEREPDEWENFPVRVTSNLPSPLDS